MEVQYELLSFGIPVAALPVNSNGICSTDYHLSWLRWRQELERKQRMLHNESKEIAAGAKSITTTTAMEVDHSFPVVSNTSVTAPQKDTSPTPHVLEIIVEPLDNDCVLGRGKAIDQHVGNVKFRHLLRRPSVMLEFQNTPKHMKFQFAQSARRELEDYHGMRFLKENPNGFGWVMADDSAIKGKILRTMNRFKQQKKRSK